MVASCSEKKGRRDGRGVLRERIKKRKKEKERCGERDRLSTQKGGGGTTVCTLYSRDAQRAVFLSQW